MYEIKKLSEHASAQCRVVLSGGAITLVSYQTEVVKVSRCELGWIVSCSGLYSMTTRRHISWFLKEYFPNLNYYDIKAIAGTEDVIRLDIYGNKHNGVIYNG